MPSAKVKLGILSDLLWNAFTGFHEGELETTTERTEARKQNVLTSIQTLMRSIVGPGDFLDSHFRATFAKEAYAAFSCPCRAEQTCLRDPKKFVSFNKDQTSHTYVTDHPFRDIAHAIVNHQDKLNEAFFDTVVKRLEEFFPKDKYGYDLDEYRSMAIEMAIIAACSAAICEFFFATGMEPLEWPESLENQPSHFKKVSDFSSEPLSFRRDIAWGPMLEKKNLHSEIAKRFNFDDDLWDFAASSGGIGPTSKATAAPTTCMAWLRFMVDTYGHPERLTKFLRRTGRDRCLTRGQLETAATAYTGAKHCRF